MLKKNFLMLQTFAKVMFGSKKEINAITPDAYYLNIYDIDYNNLKENQIDTLLFDVDNTIAKVDDLNLQKKKKKLFDELKSRGFKIMLVSNNHPQRVIPIAQALNIPMLADAGKPTKAAYNQALNIIKSGKENVVAVGDQLLSDIVGAKKYGIKAILVDPLSEENNIQTGMAQKLQKHMIKKLTKKKILEIGKHYH